MNPLIVIILALALVGCTPTQTTQGATSLCNSAANSLKVLTTARAAGKLSAAQVQSVHDAETLIDPVCTAPTPPIDAAAAASNLAAGLAALVTVQSQVR